MPPDKTKFGEKIVFKTYTNKFYVLNKKKKIHFRQQTPFVPMIFILIKTEKNVTGQFSYY